MANTKLWLGQWECVLQERDPAPSTTHCCNLLPHKGHSSQEQRRISSETLAHFRFGQVSYKCSFSVHILSLEEKQQRFALLSGPSAQKLKNTSANTNPIQLTKSNPARLLGLLESNCFCTSPCLGNWCTRAEFKCCPHVGESRAETHESPVQSPHIPFSSENPQVRRMEMTLLQERLST